MLVYTIIKENIHLHTQVKRASNRNLKAFEKKNEIKNVFNFDIGTCSVCASCSRR